MTLEEIALRSGLFAGGSGCIVLLGKRRAYAVSDGAYSLDVYSKGKARLWPVSFQNGMWVSYGNPLFKTLDSEGFVIGHKDDPE